MEIPAASNVLKPDTDVTLNEEGALDVVLNRNSNGVPKVPKPKIPGGVPAGAGAEAGFADTSVALVLRLI